MIMPRLPDHCCGRLPAAPLSVFAALIIGTMPTADAQMRVITGNEGTSLIGLANVEYLGERYDITFSSDVGTDEAFGEAGPYFLGDPVASEFMATEVVDVLKSHWPQITTINGDRGFILPYEEIRPRAMDMYYWHFFHATDYPQRWWPRKGGIYGGYAETPPGFRSYLVVTPVPEPTGTVLFATACCGLIAVGRKKRACPAMVSELPRRHCRSRDNTAVP